MPLQTETERLAAREFSRRLFGGSLLRLEVGAAIADAGGLANLSDLVATLGDPPGKTSVQHELNKLRAARLLGRPAVLGGKKYFEAIDCPFWSMCQALGRTALDVVGPPPYD